MSRNVLPNRFGAVLFGIVALVTILCAGAAETPSHFDQANRLYEQGKFSEAASLYESMLKAGTRSPEIFFNLFGKIARSFLHDSTTLVTLCETVMNREDFNAQGKLFVAAAESFAWR